MAEPLRLVTEGSNPWYFQKDLEPQTDSIYMTATAPAPTIHITPSSLPFPSCEPFLNNLFLLLYPIPESRCQKFHFATILQNQAHLPHDGEQAPNFAPFPLDIVLAGEF